MRAKRYSVEQIVAKLREAEKLQVLRWAVVSWAAAARAFLIVRSA